MRREGFAVVVGMLFATACTIVTGLHTPPPEPPPAPPPPTDPCHHATFPTQPLGGNEPGDREIVVAIRTFDFGVADGAPLPGFDIDQTCTCAADGGVGESCVTANRHCDDPEGRDNVTQLILKRLQVVGPDIEERMNANFTYGINTLLLRVQRYNGLENDSDVIVSMMASDGLQRTLADGGTAYDVPSFDGGDRWSVKVSQLVPPYDQYISRQAGAGYVSGRTLVFHQPSITLPLREGAGLNLSDVVLVGTIDPSGTTITSGTLAARWPLEAALQLAGEFAVPDGSGRPLCEDSLFDTLVKPLICPEADLTESASAPPASPCNALSFAVAFTAAPAGFGAIIDRALSPPLCHDPSVFRCP
jgi:hypothetical protein